MFGQNPIAPTINSQTGQHLMLVKGSPFDTIQGEGPYAGYPATFIRLHGCNLRCTFCDTQFSDPDDPLWDLDDLVQTVKPRQPDLVVITGGEPLRQNIFPLAMNLAMCGKRVQIETAGTLWIPGLERMATVVLSPKTPEVNAAAWTYAAAFKYVIDVEQSFEDGIPITATQPGAKPRRLARPRPGAPVYYSPMDMGDEARNQANRSLVAQLAKQYNRIAGLQLHKFMGVD